MEPTREHLAALARLLAATAPEEIDCETLLDHVAAYAEATRSGTTELDPGLERVKQHLAVCPPCLEEFRALVAALGEG